MDRIVHKNNISSPRLWIKRIALFESSEKKETPIRNVVFQRGLNIVWGVELPDEAGVNITHPVTISGHSVGKTILCRLIRYCLGESTFGNQRVLSRIRYAFPKGWVGMELAVNGQDWAVLKSLDLSGNFTAGQEITVEGLFDQDRQKNQYRRFIDNLQNVMMSRLHSSAPPDSDKYYEWRHLLAWLTRDQESRFQSPHDWRSPRSGSDTPKFQKPKEHALYLIRLVLDLVQDKELDVSRAITEGERELKQRETQITELKREPEYSFNEHDKAIKRLLDVKSTEMLNIDELDLTSPVFIRRMKIEGAISTIQRDLERVDLKIAQKRIWLASYDEQHRAFRAALEVIDEATELKDDQESEDDTIQKLRELRGKNCTYGDVLFLDCSYVQERLEKAEKIIDLQKVREDQRQVSETEMRLSILEQQRKDHDQIVELLNQLRQKLAKDMAEKREKELELAEHREKLQRLGHHLEQRKQAIELIEGHRPNTKLQQETIRANELQDIIKRHREELNRIQKNHKHQLGSISEIYDSIIKRVLSSTYSGILQMTKGEPQFHIEETTDLSGEAVETLALVLADVAAMICSCKGIGHHPRFLLHDGPREADLDRHIYSHYLRSMWTLTNEFGGPEKAPFQYIVTTTSKPPDELKDAICLRLQAHPETEMLFRRLLPNLPTQEQITLFGE